MCIVNVEASCTIRFGVCNIKGSHFIIFCPFSKYKGRFASKTLCIKLLAFILIYIVTYYVEQYVLTFMHKNVSHTLAKIFTIYLGDSNKRHIVGNNLP